MRHISPSVSFSFRLTTTARKMTETTARRWPRRRRRLGWWWWWWWWWWWCWCCWWWWLLPKIHRSWLALRLGMALETIGAMLLYPSTLPVRELFGFWCFAPFFRYLWDVLFFSTRNPFLLGVTCHSEASLWNILLLFWHPRKCAHFDKDCHPMLCLRGNSLRFRVTLFFTGQIVKQPTPMPRMPRSEGSWGVSAKRWDSIRELSLSEHHGFSVKSLKLWKEKP